jgi:hypothetical protein
MAIIRTDWDTSTGKETLRNVVRITYDNTARETLTEWKELFKDERTDLYQETVQRIAGLGAMSATAEGENYHIETPKYNTTKTYTQAKYTNGFRITEEMQKFNKISLMKTLTASLAQTMAEGKDIELAKMWNNTTATTYAAGFDGLAIGSASHTCLDDVGTTYDNLISGDLTVANLESALQYFDAVYDDQGNIFVHIPRKLVVNKNLRQRAYKILKSSGQYDEQSNTINAFKEYDLRTFVYHRLSSSTAWFVLGDQGNKNYGPIVFTSQEPELRQKDAPDATRDLLVTSGQLFTYGSPDNRLVVVGNT